MDGQRVSEGRCCRGAGVRQDDEGFAGVSAGGLAGTIEGPLQRSEAGLCVGWGEGEALSRKQGGVSVMGGPERPVLGRARVVALRAGRNVQGRGEVLRVTVDGFVQRGNRVRREVAFVGGLALGCRSCTARVPQDRGGDRSWEGGA